MAVGQASDSIAAQKKSPVQKAMVIGGGVSGMQAALDIANQGFKVYLVEKTESIGGKMAMLDKTFPTLDCSACILTPRLSEVSRHPMIEILTLAEVQSINGKAGDFRVEVHRKARFVDEDKCSGCGSCIAECPVEVPNEFDQGLGFRKAIYIPFPQATPNVCTIDAEVCKRCNRCVRACDRGAINLNMEDETLEVSVGAVIFATGYELFDVSKYPQYGYMKFQNVINAMEYERLINAAGPTHGHLIRLSDGKIPQNIGFIQCVGARDVHMGVPYCSRVCCMYGIKLGIMAKEHNPDTEVTIYYADIRAFGKGYEEFYQMAKTRYGIKFIRGRVGDVEEDPETFNLSLTADDVVNDRLMHSEHDMVIISPGVQPSTCSESVYEVLGVGLDNEGYVWEKHPFLGPVCTNNQGIFVCGCSDGPKDIPDSVAAGSAAAMKATIIIAKRGEE
ncbi:MAG: CoB--CoM heterodisulfide reductase iron-sulfur subunit A family protein [Candidatus Thorarchaeota archaeon]